MKGHKAHHHARKHHAAGGAEHGSREWEQDLSYNPEARDNAHKIEGEAEHRKNGGRAKRKHGGHVTHHSHPMKHAKHLGKVHGAAAVHHAGRKPRKSGGHAGSNMNPLSSAYHGTHPRGHKDTEID
jgi:hypothetical protein